MFNKVTLRSKLLIALGVPLLALIAVTGLRVSDSLGDADLATEQLEEVQRTLQLEALAQALQTERDAFTSLDGSSDQVLAGRANFDAQMSAFLAAPGATPADLIATAEDVQATIERFREAIPADLTEFRTKLADEVARGVNATVDGSTTQAATGYAGQIDRLYGLVQYDPSKVINGETAQDLTSLSLASRLAEAFRGESAVYFQVSQFPPEAVTVPAVSFVQAQAESTLTLEENFRSLSNQKWRPQIDALFETEAYLAYSDLRTATDEWRPGQPAPMNLIGLAGSSVQTIGAVDELRAEIFSSVESDAIAYRDEARDQASTTVIVVAAVGLTLLLLVAVLYRSIRRPITRLTDRTREVASVQLPEAVSLMRSQGADEPLPELEPLEASTSDEIGELVGAFNQMSTTAVHLAGQQAASRRVVADMFVNLGRRNQKLLLRMLDHLESLQAEEEDPNMLEELYRVDHLATRMRRNAESLLVLAGARAARQFDEPVPVSEVLRASLTEVEDYDRVRLTVNDEALVAGSVVADLGHLVAELVENALIFSPADRPVELMARNSRNGFVVGVIDQGLGMSVDDLARANARLVAAADEEETPSKYLGLHVVGRLAARHDISVELLEGIPSGVTARVRLPESALAADPDVSGERGEDLGMGAPVATLAARVPGASELVAATSRQEPVPVMAALDAPHDPDTNDADTNDADTNDAEENDLEPSAVVQRAVVESTVERAAEGAASAIVEPASHAKPEETVSPREEPLEPSVARVLAELDELPEGVSLDDLAECGVYATQITPVDPPVAEEPVAEAPVAEEPIAEISATDADHATGASTTTPVHHAVMAAAPIVESSVDGPPPSNRVDASNAGLPRRNATPAPESPEPSEAAAPRPASSGSIFGAIRRNPGAHLPSAVKRRIKPSASLADAMPEVPADASTIGATLAGFQQSVRRADERVRSGAAANDHVDTSDEITNGHANTNDGVSR